MRSETYPIANVASGQLAIVARPRGGDWLEDEVTTWKRAGLEIIVSLLTEDELLELDLRDEPRCCEQANIRLIRHPIPDRGLPESAEQFSALIASVVEDLRAGRSVGVHCRMGIGRSSLCAVCVLAAMGVSVETAWKSVAEARRISVPDTPQQRAWVARFANGQLK